jgi:hypothetical protein
MTAVVSLLSPARGLHRGRSALYDSEEAPDAVALTGRPVSWR